MYVLLTAGKEQSKNTDQNDVLSVLGIKKDDDILQMEARREFCCRAAPAESVLESGVAKQSMSPEVGFRHF